MASIVKMVVELMNRDSAYDDTDSDRLNHIGISSVLIICSILITSSQYVGEPIQCWMPQEFNKNQGSYVEDFCWVHGTYYVPFENENIPSLEGEGRRPSVTFYQWLPIILLIQALMYGVGHKIWSNLYIACGLDLENFFEEGKRLNILKMMHQKDQILQDMASMIERYLNDNNVKRSLKHANTLSLKHIFSLTCFRRCSARRLNYLVTLLLFVKIIYVLNAVGQFFFLTAALNTNFWIYGISILKGMLQGGVPFHSWPFPKVTMCDLKIRRFGNIHNYTVQCALMINLFNEKIFIIIWLLMIFGLVTSIISLIKWSIWTIGRYDRYKYVRNLLLMARVIKPKKTKNTPLDTLDGSRYQKFNNNNSMGSVNLIEYVSSSDGEAKEKRRYSVNIKDKKMDMQSKQFVHLVWFVERHLRLDGVLILHLLELATSRIIAMEVVEKLWNNFTATTAVKKAWKDFEKKSRS